jgi:hypothetical protein
MPLQLLSCNREYRGILLTDPCLFAFERDLIVTKAIIGW